MANATSRPISLRRHGGDPLKEAKVARVSEVEPVELLRAEPADRVVLMRLAVLYAAGPGRRFP